MSTCVPNRGECWPDSVICVGEGRVRRGRLGWRKGSRARVEEGEERSSSSIYSLLPLPTLPYSLWNAWGRRREQCNLCVRKSVCVGTEVLWGGQGEFMCPCLEGGGSAHNNCGCS